MKRTTRRLAAVLLALGCLLLSGCDGSVGVGINVGVPIGNNGHLSIGTGRWY